MSSLYLAVDYTRFYQHSYSLSMVFFIHNGHGAIKEEIIAKLGAHTSYIHLT